MADEPRATLPEQAPDPAAVRRMLRRLSSAAAAPWLHGEIARRMAGRLPAIRLQPAAIANWWSFLGASDAALAQAYPNARRLHVEPVEALAARSRALPRPAWWSARRWRGAVAAVRPEADVEPGSCQLVWANMMLHTSSDPGRVMAAWHRALAVDGFVMFSCFGPDTLMELRALYRGLGWPAPSQAFIDMHDLGDDMVRAGFAAPVMDQERIRLTWPDAGALLAELRTLGGNLRAGRAPGLRTPRWKARLLEALPSLAGADGRPALTFEIVYGHAFKPVPRVTVAGETAVSLEQMRAMTRAGRVPPR